MTMAQYFQRGDHGAKSGGLDGPGGQKKDGPDVGRPPAPAAGLRDALSCRFLHGARFHGLSVR
jgi:hypothetical protein